MSDFDLRCSTCGRAFSREERFALMCGRIMGDECTDCYYWCQECQVFTLRLYREPFLGEETHRDSDPISRKEGERRLALIRRCPEPWNGRCRCPAHQEYFGGWLD